MKNIQLSRELTFEINGEQKKGVLRIDGVEQLTETKWACYWSLSYINPERAKIYGADALDALTNCLNFITDLIRGSEEDGLKIWWHCEGDHGGMLE